MMTWFLVCILAVWVGLGLLTWVGLDPRRRHMNWVTAPILMLTWPLVWLAVLVIAVIHATAARAGGGPDG